MDGTEATTTRRGTCKVCGCTVEAGLRGRLPQYCGSCKKNRPSKDYKYTRTCADCSCEFTGNRTRKYCDDCHQKRFLSGATFSCAVCGDVRKRRAQGGRSSGLCCSKKCGGVLRTIRAKERARHRGDGLRLLLSYVRKLIEKEKSESAKEYMRACLDVANWMHDWDSCLRERRVRRRSRPKGSQKHCTRAKRRGLPRNFGKSVSIKSIGDRDRWVCGICREPIVDQAARSGPYSASVDHIVPLNHPLNTKHGHTPSNVQIAHRKCNELKGCAVACESLLWCDNPREYVTLNAVDQRIEGGAFFSQNQN